MSEHNVSEIPATPMDAIKQIYELFQTRENFITGSWAQNREHLSVNVNDADACCWCLSGAVFHVYNIAYKCDSPDDYNPEEFPEELVNNLDNTFKILWEKLPAGSKISYSYPSIRNYISAIPVFNDTFGYTGVMQLLQAIVNNTEYTLEA